MKKSEGCVIYLASFTSLMVILNYKKLKKNKFKLEFIFLLFHYSLYVNLY